MSFSIPRGIAYSLMAQDTSPDELLRKWLGHTTTIQKAHFDMVKSLQRYNLFLGIPVVVISAAVGSSVFAVLQKEIGIEAKVVLAIFSLLASILAALQTLLRFAERLERHRVAGVEYGILKRDIEFALAVPREDALKEQELARTILNRLNALAKDSPPLPEAKQPTGVPI